MMVLVALLTGFVLRQYQQRQEWKERTNWR